MAAIILPAVLRSQGMTAPLIGVTTAISTDGSPDRAYLNRAYLHAVQQAGGIPLLLPPQLTEASWQALSSHMDALILTGGGDVEPARYGAAADPATTDVSPARDALELALTRRALEEQRPILAICRGIQVLNVALGGTLAQDLAGAGTDGIAHAQKEPRDQPTHPVRIAVEGTRLGRIVGAAELAVNSFHHQAIARVGHRLREVAWAPDGVVEAVELVETARFVIGVQWHPEELVERDAAARALFAAVVETASARRQGRAR
jgi:putative glutamine amidotransferase